MESRDVVWFTDVGIADVARVGGKNGSLGKMVHGLSSAGVRVPEGFATTASAYRAFVAHNRLEPRIRAALGSYRRDETTLDIAGETIREALLSSEFPAGLADAIRPHIVNWRDAAVSLASAWPCAVARQARGSAPVASVHSNYPT